MLSQRVYIYRTIREAPAEDQMRTTNLLLYVRSLVERDEGQDLVEYALVVALIAFGAIVSMKFLAGGINTAFSDIATTLTSNIT